MALLSAKKYVTDKTATWGHSHQFIQKTELTTGIILTLITIFLHLTFMRHAGAFWRDEVNSINLATMPSISDIWHYLKYDCHPILLSLILRFWIGIGGRSECGLRAFGLLIGISTVAVFWLNGRFLRFRVPLLALALFAFNAMTTQVGDSIRPYGIGILFILLTLGLLWKVVEQGRTWQIAACMASAVLSVQCLYQNTFFLAAIIFAGILVTIRNKQWKRAASVAVIGIAAVLSFLPYLQPVKNSQDWVIIVKYPVSFLTICQEFSSALSSEGRFVSVIWAGLFLLAVCILFYLHRPPTKSLHDQTQKDLVLFCATAMITCTAALLLFLRFMQVCIVPWYYLPLMAIAAVSLDAILGNSNLWSIVRIILAILVVTIIFGTAWQSAHERRTNIDIAASTLEKSAGKDDLIIVNPWYLAVSFQWYYHGIASFTTIPPIEDHTIHRFDLVKAKMASADTIEQVLSEISRTLKSGGSVWVVGWISIPPKDYLPQLLPPAPNSIYGWSEGAYATNWEELCMYFVLSHSIQSLSLPPVTNKPVTPFEKCSIAKFQGWQ
jgi:hypothetical protein